MDSDSIEETEHSNYDAVFYIEGLGILSVGVVGCLINLTAIWRLVFGQGRRKRHTFHYLLISLSAYDLLHIILSIACFALPQLSTEYRNNVLIHTIPYLIPLAQMTLSSSSFTTVALTVERYLSLCVPFLRYRYNLRPVHYILSVLIFSTVYNTPRFFEWRTWTEVYERPCYANYLDESFSNESLMANSSLMYPDDIFDFQNEFEQSNCSETVRNVTLVATSLRRNHTYVLVYINWMNFTINLLTPLIILFAMNLSIYRVLRKLRITGEVKRKGSQIPRKGSTMFHNRKRDTTLTCSPQNGRLQVPNFGQVNGHPRRTSEERERDASYTRASILMVVVFVLCHTPRLITNTMELFIDQEHLPTWVELLVCVNHLLVTINSSFNFLLYLMATKKKIDGGSSPVTQGFTVTTCTQRTNFEHQIVPLMETSPLVETKKRISESHNHRNHENHHISVHIEMKPMNGNGIELCPEPLIVLKRNSSSKVNQKPEAIQNSEAIEDSTFI